MTLNREFRNPVRSVRCNLTMPGGNLTMPRRGPRQYLTTQCAINALHRQVRSIVNLHRRLLKVPSDPVLPERLIRTGLKVAILGPSHFCTEIRLYVQLHSGHCLVPVTSPNAIVQDLPTVRCSHPYPAVPGRAVAIAIGVTHV